LVEEWKRAVRLASRRFTRELTIVAVMKEETRYWK
jgi:hypothetical protein